MRVYFLVTNGYIHKFWLDKNLMYVNLVQSDLTSADDVIISMSLEFSKLFKLDVTKSFSHQIYTAGKLWNTCSIDSTTALIKDIFALKDD